MAEEQEQIKTAFDPSKMPVVVDENFQIFPAHMILAGVDGHGSILTFYVKDTSQPGAQKFIAKASISFDLFSIRQLKKIAENQEENIIKVREQLENIKMEITREPAKKKRDDPRGYQ